MRNTHRHLPLYIVVVAMTLFMAATSLIQVFSQRDSCPVNRFALGFDYNDFYRASLFISNGVSPYEVERYVTPPIPAIVNVPITVLPFRYARYVVMFGLIASVGLSLFLLSRYLAPAEGHRAALFHGLLYFIIVSLSYPFVFLLDRGNIDGFVLLLLSCGFCIAARSARCAAIFFGLAISAKVYPVLVLLPIVAARRWRLLLFMAVVLIGLVLVAPLEWHTYVTDRLAVRTSSFRIDENGSLACTLYYIGNALRGLFHPLMSVPVSVFFMKSSMFVWGALLLLAFRLDANSISMRHHEEFSVRAILYLPFMVAVPQLAYHYELVCLLALLPALCWCWKRSDTTIQRASVILMTLGLAMSQFPAVTLHTLTSVVGWHAVPGLGLFVVLLGSIALRFAWGDSLVSPNKKRGLCCAENRVVQ